MKQTQPQCYSAMPKTDTLPDGSFRNKVQQIFQSKKAGTSKVDVSSVIETAFLFQGSPERERHNCYRSKSSPDLCTCTDPAVDSSGSRTQLYQKPWTAMPNHCYSSPDLCENTLDQMQCQQVAVLLRKHLVTSQTSCLQCHLLLPENLISRVAEDIVRMSHSEPCGLRGCILYLTMQRAEGSQKVGKIECDPDTVATFELHLTLKEDVKHWFNLKSLLLQLIAGCSPGGARDDVYISPGYQLAKKKLYRPN